MNTKNLVSSPAPPVVSLMISLRLLSRFHRLCRRRLGAERFLAGALPLFGNCPLSPRVHLRYQPRGAYKKVSLRLSDSLWMELRLVSLSLGVSISFLVGMILEEGEVRVPTTSTTTLSISHSPRRTLMRFIRRLPQKVIPPDGGT